MLIVDKTVGTGEIKQKMVDVPFEKREKIMFTGYMVVLIIMELYSIFLPLKLGTNWFYTGLAIYLLGLTMFLTAIVNISTTPLGQPFTSGMYRYSRHPLLFSSSLTFIGISVATASLAFLLLSVLVIILQISQATAEERVCLETYGDDYKEYMNRTHRWIGMPVSR
jgi:protein-S-isoprenylcysteine O-methyltransferase Ste14